MVHSTFYRKFRNLSVYNKDIYVLVFVFVVYVALRHIYSDHSNLAFNHVEGINENESKTFGQYEHVFVNKAKQISLRKQTVLLSVVNNAYLPLANSWLCNTMYMGIHDSMLVITTDAFSKNKLTKDWPSLNIVNLDLDIPQGNQFYSHVGYIKIMVLRTKIIVSLLEAGINIMLIEFDFLWFKNPLPYLSAMSGYDMLLQPVSNSEGKLVCGGFMFIFATNRSVMVFKKLSDMMSELETGMKEEDSKKVSRRENDQEYLSSLVIKRYGGVAVHYLPKETYADGKWYKLEESKRRAMQPIVVHNNFIIGNKNKIKRAKQWKHWFVQTDGKCDTNLVNMTVT